MNRTVHRSITASLKLETSHIVISSRMDDYSVVYSHTGRACNDRINYGYMPQHRSISHKVEQKKPAAEECALYDPIYMEFFK